jgi:hypothetical protein
MQAPDRQVTLACEVDVKRIIDGLTYNTDTATPVAKYEYTDPSGYDTEATVYQTRGGAFFIVHEWEVDEKPKVYFEASSRDEIMKLVERTNNLVILNEQILQEPPEAAAESAPAATLYIRVPATLKDRLDTLARHENVSLNTWTMRCVERCAQMDKVGELLGEIMQTGLSVDAGADDAGMIKHMWHRAEDIAEVLGWRGKDLENLCTNASVAATSGSDEHQHWPLLADEEDEQDRRHRLDLLKTTQKWHDERQGRRPWNPQGSTDTRGEHHPGKQPAPAKPAPKVYRRIPEPGEGLRPVIEGAQKVLNEHNKTAAKTRNKRR